MVLAKRSVLLQEVGQVAGDGMGAGAERDDFLEVLGLVLLIGNGSAVAVQLAGGRPPAGRVEAGDDAVNAVGGQEAVVDALSQAVGVDRGRRSSRRCPRCRRASEWRSCRTGGRGRSSRGSPANCFRRWRCRGGTHRRRSGRRSRAGILVQARPPFVARKGLVEGEVHVPALDHLAVFDFLAGVAEGGEGLVLGVIDQECCGRPGRGSWGGGIHPARFQRAFQSFQQI